MLTIRQALAVTPQKIKQGAKYGRILTAKMTKSRDGFLRVDAVVQRTIEGQKHPRHKCSIQATSKDQTSLANGYCLFDCDCGSHVYWGAEYVLFKKGAAKIIHGDGSAPQIRNPQNRAYLCPHLTKLAVGIINLKKR